MDTKVLLQRAAGAATDEQTLEGYGYRQELRRTLGYFSSFAISFSVISVTTGLFADYGSRLQTGGPVFIWTWLIVGAGQFLVALLFALAKQIPLSGYASGPGNLWVNDSPGGAAGS